VQLLLKGLDKPVIVFLRSETDARDAEFL